MGRANKWADKWAKDGTNVWHEKWGEEYDGEGGCVKFTDKVLLVCAQTSDFCCQTLCSVICFG